MKYVKYIENIFLVIGIIAFVYFMYIFLSADDQSVAPSPTNTTSREVLVKDSKPLYSYGTCETDNDCVFAGCSSEFCSSDPTLTTVCVVPEDLPDTGIYSCGCVKTRCVWYK